MLRQTEIDFTVHQYESNAESQKTLDKGRNGFSKNCKILYDAFMAGEILNSDNSPVREFRRRKQDLTDVNGVKISYHSSSGNLKNWYMTPEQIKSNKEKFGSPSDIEHNLKN